VTRLPATDPANYVDCVSYGQYAEIPTSTRRRPPDIAGYSIQRISDTDDSFADFVCGDPITPENNAGESVDLASSAPCGTPTSTTTLQAPPACGDGNEDGSVSATDALLTLTTAVGAGSCPLCLCDVDLSADVSATDALRVLNAAVGVPVTLQCPAC
jgi:hypothetical protein